MVRQPQNNVKIPSALGPAMVPRCAWCNTILTTSQPVRVVRSGGRTRALEFDDVQMCRRCSRRVKGAGPANQLIDLAWQWLGQVDPDKRGGDDPFGLLRESGHVVVVGGSLAALMPRPESPA